MAGFIQIPSNQSVTLGSTATFGCVTTDVLDITFMVNSIFIILAMLPGVTQSVPIYSSPTTVYRYVSVLGTKDNDKLEIMCVAFLLNDTLIVSSPAYLHLTGLSSNVGVGTM